MKKEYIAPIIKVMRVGGEDEVCGLPVFFSKTQGPGTAGGKEGFFDDEFEDEEDFEEDFNTTPWDF